MRGSMTDYVTARPALNPALHTPSEITPIREHIFLSERGMRWTHLEDGQRSNPMRASILECIATSGISVVTSAFTYVIVKSGALGPRVRRFIARERLRNVPSVKRHVDSCVSKHPENASIARAIWEEYVQDEGLPSPSHDPVPGERQHTCLNPEQAPQRHRQKCPNPVQLPKRRPEQGITKH